jgi:hypothetical protein
MNNRYLPQGDDDDFLDGMCDRDLNGPATSDEDVPYVVLFADVDRDDPGRVEAARKVWEAAQEQGLFDAS